MKTSILATLLALFSLLLILSLYACQRGDNSSTASADDEAQLPGTPVDAQPSKSLIYKTAIRTVLEQDSINADTNKGNYTAIANGMRQFDLSQCPRDFAVAYVVHMQAWKYAGDIQDAIAAYQSGDVTRTAAVLTLVQEIFGVNHTAFDDVNDKVAALKEKAAGADDQIRITFNNVEQLAVLYGVRLH